jgi:tRNA threonylcarbamoyl adenosine modification protein (Sua5/YciO/YrdC/YwlC family)
MLLSIHPQNPEPRKINQVLEVIRRGGIVIFPTDSIYAIGCDLTQSRSIEKVCKIMGKKPEKANLSLICSDLSVLSQYCAPINSSVFKLIRRCLPGPYTFILKSSRLVPRLFQTNKKTVGIRVPNNIILQAILSELENPLVSASVHADDEIQDYLTDPLEIAQRYAHLVDLIIDGGIGQNEPSTVIDCTEGYPVLVRQGLGAVDVDIQ